MNKPLLILGAILTCMNILTYAGDQKQWQNAVGAAGIMTGIHTMLFALPRTFLL